MRACSLVLIVCIASMWLLDGAGGKKQSEEDYLDLKKMRAHEENMHFTVPSFKALGLLSEYHGDEQKCKNEVGGAAVPRGTGACICGRTLPAGQAVACEQGEIRRKNWFQNILNRDQKAQTLTCSQQAECADKVYEWYQNSTRQLSECREALLYHQALVREVKATLQVDISDYEDTRAGLIAWLERMSAQNGLMVAELRRFAEIQKDHDRMNKDQLKLQAEKSQLLSELAAVEKEAKRVEAERVSAELEYKALTERCDSKVKILTDGLTENNIELPALVHYNH